MATTSSARLTFSVRRAPDGWFELSWRCADRDLFFQVRDAIKLLPPAARTYDAVRKLWRVRSIAHLLGLTLYLPGLAERLEELLADDDDEPETPAPPTLPAEVERGYGTLWLVPGCPRPVLDAVHRTLAKLYHPDTGAGDAATMKRINAAYDLVVGWQERQQHRHQHAASARSRRTARGKGAAA